jgi:hypothetical protein
MNEFTSDIRVDNLTNQKCCLFNYAILNIKSKQNVTLFVPSKQFDKELPDNISCNSSNDNLIQLDGVESWAEKIEKVPVKKGVWVLISDYVNSNAGHVLGDEVYAIWQSLCVFGLQEHDFNIITNNHFIHKQIYQCLTKKKIYSFEEFKNKDLSFEHLIVGMARNGYALGHNNPINKKKAPKNASNVSIRSLDNRASYLPPFNETFEAFRNHCYKIFDIDETSHSFQNHKRTILFLDKCEKVSDHTCKLYEIDKIIKLVQEKHFNYNVKKINWNGMKIGDQVKEMAMADIVISLPGSDLMNCIFLNPKGHIICPDRFYYNGDKQGSNEIAIWFQFTHNCIEISDTLLVKTDSQLYSKVNEDLLLKYIDNILSIM